MAGRTISNATVLWLIRNITDEMRAQLHSLQSDLDRANYTLSQRIGGMEDDGRSHKTRLDALTENYANVTAHVVSIENSLREHAAAMAVPVPATAAPPVSIATLMTTSTPVPVTVKPMGSIETTVKTVDPTVIAATGNNEPPMITRTVSGALSADASLIAILSDSNAPERS